MYSSTGSRICFHVLSRAALSTLEVSGLTGAPRSSSASVAANRPLNGGRGVSRPASDASPGLRGESSNPPGDRSGDIGNAGGDGGVGRAEAAKKAVTKVYSAVALSISTRRMERRRASIGSF